MSLKLENTLCRAGVNFFARLIKGGNMSASCLLRIIILEETLQSYDSHYNYLSIRLNFHIQAGTSFVQEVRIVKKM